MISPPQVANWLCVREKAVDQRVHALLHFLIVGQMLLLLTMLTLEQPSHQVMLLAPSPSQSEGHCHENVHPKDEADSGTGMLTLEEDAEAKAGFQKNWTTAMSLSLDSEIECHPKASSTLSAESFMSSQSAQLHKLLKKKDAEKKLRSDVKKPKKEDKKKEDTLKAVTHRHLTTG